jgi:hypothetical protein
VKVVELNEATRLPLGLVISLVGGVITGVIGSVFWLTVLYSDVAYAKRDLSSLEEKFDKRIELLNSIDKRMARIEVKLGIVSDNSK